MKKKIIYQIGQAEEKDLGLPFDSGGGGGGAAARCFFL